MALIPKKHVTFLIDPSMRDYLETMADDERIALSAAIRKILQIGINEREAKKGDRLPINT